MTAPPPTSSDILRHTSAFLDDALSNPDLRRSILSAARSRVPSSFSSSPAAAPLLQALALLSQALDSGYHGGATPTRPSPAALRAAEKLLLSLPRPAAAAPTPLSALLLALAAAARRRAPAAAAALLDLFALDPALARHEVAPALFEDLFVPHLLPITRWFGDQRSRILSSSTTTDRPPPPAAAAGAAAGAEEEDEGRSVAMAAAAVLSRMSGEQAAELKDLEKGYEEVLDANSRVYAQYLKNILESGDRSSDVPGPPELIWTRISSGTKETKEAVLEEEEDDDDADDDDDDEKVENGEEARRENGLRNGRYNPIWAEADQAFENFSRQSTGKQRNVSKYPSLYPQRVSPLLLFRQSSNGDNYSASLKSQRSLMKSPPPYPHLFARQTSNADRSSEANILSDHSSAVSFDGNSEDSSEIEADKEERNTSAALQQNKRIHFQIKKQGFAKPVCPPSPPMVDSDKILSSGRQTPPKDFVCPITSQLFDDPVTLETGQTYERKAIQEWMERGNSTCPITRQQLHSTQLPKTNYVLKRLIASWQEHHPYSTPARMGTPPPKSASDTNQLILAPSPTSVISQASFDCTTGDLCLAISRLCTSEDLSESEMAVLQIERLFRETNGEVRVLTALSKPAVVNGFVEILFNSINPQVLRVAVFLLSKLASEDKLVVQTLTRVDSDVDCMVALFKKGLIEAVVLIYLLSPSSEWLIEMDMTEALMMAIKKKEDDQLAMCVKPKAASVFLLGQILREDYKNASLIVSSIISEKVIESVILSLESELVEERTAAVGILLRCMEEDGHCRNVIAEKAELVPVLESFSVVSDAERFEIVQFLYELVKLRRRSSCEHLLRIIKDGGTFSMMHTLLVYLQTAVQERLPIIAGLLLQLDLLVEPRKMSIYREEAIDALISCLKSADFPRIQLLAAETILVLQSRFSDSGRPLARAFLLKHARMNKRYRALMRAEKMGNFLEDSEDNSEEEKAADEWERKVAYSLASHEFGLLFEGLSEGLKSRDMELFSACLVSATWLIHMLSFLPDTGVRGAARVCLLRQYISILKSARHTDERVFAMLALRNFMHDPEGMHDVTLHIKDVVKTLRELKKSSVLAYDMLKLLSDGQESSVDMWSHKELVQIDCATNGEVLSIIYFKILIFSGHSDGTIKVWEGSDNLLHPVNEFREHSKAVTSLAISNSGEKLYSGSLDKSIRVWAIRDRGLHCVEFHDAKEQVHNLTVSNTIACFTPQGAGVKVLSWNGNSKLLNPNKHARSLVQVQGKLYCGCNDSSIQEIDLATGTLATIQSGNKKLLGKANPIYAVQIHDELLYSASTSVDGVAVKIWSTSNYNLVGSIPSTMEVRSMVISDELIYLGSKVGVVEIWSKEKLTKIGALQTGTNARVQCMAIDGDGEVLVVGTSDGKIQAWGLA